MASSAVATAPDASAMWVSLSEGNVFSIYPKLLAEILVQDEVARLRGQDAWQVDNLVLPSDMEWRLKQYFQLVRLQRLALEMEEGAEQKETPTGVEVWDPWPHVPRQGPRTTPAPVPVRSQPGPEWGISEVVIAAKLLWKPPKKTAFADEVEMRKVYSLIYDMFRYKTVLKQTLDDVHFFNLYPQHAQQEHATWLFLMELTRRRWLSRTRQGVATATRLLRGLGEEAAALEADLWDQRVHLAAAVAKIRIKNRAFSMSDLLPLHLRDERVSSCATKDCYTGWVNMARAKNVNNLIRRLKELGYSYSSSRQLCAMEYRFDRVCARFVTLKPPPKTSIGQNCLIKEGVIILQEREFCEGASVLCRALRASCLRGHVVQTHATSPRTTAYLAGQLRELGAARGAFTHCRHKMAAAVGAPDLGRLFVFGAGNAAPLYVRSLCDMGVDACEAPSLAGAVCVVGEAVYSAHPFAGAALAGAVAALATPPNSYSAVGDPVDLVCGRGGDLAMLEILTESSIDLNSKKRVVSILEEQRKTLQFLMSKPQIQMVLYETHSALDAENETMVRTAVGDANRRARDKHLLRKRGRGGGGGGAGGGGGRAHELHAAISSTAKALVDEVEATGECSRADKDCDHRLQRSSALLKPTAPTAPTATDWSPPKSARSVPIPLDYNPEFDELPDADGREFPAEVDDEVEVYVPKCDLFEIRRLPHLGNGLDINQILERDGCFLSLIQRKKMTPLDAKYMIEVAEDRGLFGNSAVVAPVATASHKKKKDSPKRKRGGVFELDRFTAPTQASIMRSACRRQTCVSARSSPLVDTCCSVYEKRQAAASMQIKLDCSCPANHKRRRASLESTRAAPAIRMTNFHPPCRVPFPLSIQDVRLKILDTVACKKRAFV